jgi:hypothetical protein
MFGKEPAGGAKGKERASTSYVCMHAFMYVCKQNNEIHQKLFKSSGEESEGLRKNNRNGVNLIKVHYKHVCKCHNGPFCTINLY